VVASAAAPESFSGSVSSSSAAAARRRAPHQSINLLICWTSSPTETAKLMAITVAQIGWCATLPPMVPMEE